MTEPRRYEQLNVVQHGVQKLASTRAGAWLFGRVLWRLDRPVHRLTKGRHTVASVLSGLPVVMLTTTGAKTGLARTAPVGGLPTPDGLGVIASSFGRPQHPGWYFNLRANPDAIVTVEGVAHPVRAVEVTDPAQREQIWKQAVTIYPGWANYQQRVKGRTIALFVLTPRDELAG